MSPPPPPPDRPPSRGKKKKSSFRRNHDKQREADILSSLPTPQSTSNGEQQGGVTVAEFRQRQQQQQDKASIRRGKARRHPPNHMQQQLTQGEEDNGSYTEVSVAQQQQQQVVDTIPADHPSSSIVQTLRTCTICHRTLPRAQFSERDRYTIHESLATGAVCRTCSMTISAVRLKGMPNTEQLLMAYAERGEQMASMIANGAVSGFLDSGSLGAGPQQHYNNSGEEAMVIRQNSNTESFEMYKGNPVGSVAPSSSNRTVVSTMGMPSQQTFPDVNVAFSGQQYGGGEDDRPANIADCKYIDALLRLPSYLNLNAYGIFLSSADVSISMATLEAVRLYGTLEEAYFIPHDTEGLPAKTRKSNPRSVLPTEQHVVEDEAVNPKSIVCLVLGEGRTPRTAILAAQHYGWTSYAIDPSLSEGWDGYHDDIPGFTGYSGTVADFVENTEDSIIEIQNQSVKHLVIIGIQKQKDQLRLKGNGNIMEIRSRYNDVPTTLVSISPVRKATLAPKRRSGQHMSKLEKDIGYDPNCSYIDSGVFSECRLIEVWNFHNADDEEGSESDYDSYYDENSEHGEVEGQHSQGDQYRDWPAQSHDESLKVSKRTKAVHATKPSNRHEHEYDDGAIEHAIGSEGIDDDVWGKALAKHNEQEQEKLAAQYEELYMNDVSPIKMEELERTTSETAINEQSQGQAAAHEYSSRQEQSHSEEEEEAHDDMIAWSDDKLDWSDDMVADLPTGTSDTPRKSQPWHKRDTYNSSFDTYE